MGHWDGTFQLIASLLLWISTLYIQRTRYNITVIHEIKFFSSLLRWIGVINCRLLCNHSTGAFLVQSNWGARRGYCITTYTQKLSFPHKSIYLKFEGIEPPTVNIYLKIKFYDDWTAKCLKLLKIFELNNPPLIKANDSMITCYS